MKSSILLFVFILSPLAHAVTYKNVDPSRLAALVSAAQPGDRIEIAPGTHASMTLKLEGRGSKGNPIVVTGLGKAIFEGASSLIITGNDVEVREVVFRDNKLPTVVPEFFSIVSLGNFENRKEIYCTRCAFRSSLIENPSPVGVDYASTHSRYEFLKVIGFNNFIDRNTFSGRKHRAPVIHIWKTSKAEADANRIYKNRFQYNSSNQPTRNGGEQIIVGQQGRHLRNSETLIDENLFLNVTGDDEIISIKSTSVTVRKNSFVKSCGAISIRMGDKAVISDNTYIGRGIGACVKEFPKVNNLEGITVSGNSHQILNNHIQDVDVAINLRVGEHGYKDGDPRYDIAYKPISDLKIANNTFLSAIAGVDFAFPTSGGSDKRPNTAVPSLVSFTKNLVVQCRQPSLREGSVKSLTRSGNHVSDTVKVIPVSNLTPNKIILPAKLQDIGSSETPR